MMTQKDKIIGAALHHSLKAGIVINEVDHSPDRFKTKDGAHVFVKRTRSSTSPWSFEFTPSLVGSMVSLQEQADLFGGVYLWLFCGTNSICELTFEEWRAVLHTETPAASQTVRVARPPNHSFEVSGPAGALSRKVLVSRFPSLTPVA